jgi:hypothetical protein
VGEQLRRADLGVAHPHLIPDARHGLVRGHRGAEAVQTFVGKQPQQTQRALHGRGQGSRRFRRRVFLDAVDRRRVCCLAHVCFEQRGMLEFLGRAAERR